MSTLRRIVLLILVIVGVLAAARAGWFYSKPFPEITRFLYSEATKIGGPTSQPEITNNLIRQTVSMEMAQVSAGRNAALDGGGVALSIGAGPAQFPGSVTARNLDRLVLTGTAKSHIEITVTMRAGDGTGLAKKSVVAQPQDDTQKLVFDLFQALAPVKPGVLITALDIEATGGTGTFDVTSYEVMQLTPEAKAELRLARWRTLHRCIDHSYRDTHSMPLYVQSFEGTYLNGIVLQTSPHLKEAGSISYRMTFPKDADKLTFGLIPEPLGHPHGTVKTRLMFKTLLGRRTLWEHTTVFAAEPGPLGIEYFRVDVSELAGQAGILSWETEDGLRDADERGKAAIMLVTNPRIHQQQTEPQAVPIAQAAPHKPRPDQPKNVMIILLDTTRQDLMTVYGNEYDTSPVMEQFAQHAAVFENSFTTSVWTLPSQTSMMTSVYPYQHGVIYPGAKRQFGQFDTLAEILAKEGYATAAYTDGGFVRYSNGFGRGFERFTQAVGASFFNDADQDVAKVVDWLENHRSTPFFMWFQTYENHNDYVPPLEYQKLYTERLIDPEQHVHGPPFPSTYDRNVPEEDLQWFWDLYRGEMRFTDAALKQLFQAMTRLGLWENTMVLVVSDHGEGFTEHGFMYHGDPYQPVLAIPTLIYVPGGTPGYYREMTGLMDVAPTVLDWVGLDIHEQMEGQSLLPIMAPEHTEETFTEKPIYSELYVLPMAVSRRTQDRTDLAFFGRDEFRQYDRRLDPGEFNNLADPNSAESLEIATDLFRRIREKKGLLQVQVLGGDHNISIQTDMVIDQRTSVAVDNSVAFAIEPGPSRFRSRDYVWEQNDRVTLHLRHAEETSVFYGLGPYHTLRIGVTTEQGPVPESEFFVGNKFITPGVNPMELNMSDPAMDIERYFTAPTLPEDAKIHVRIGRQGEGADAGIAPQMDPEMEAQLRALGYVD